MLYQIDICDNNIDCWTFSSHAPFWKGHQSATIKMVANTSDSKTTIAEELVQLFKRIDYDETVCCLKQQYAVPIESFNTMDIAEWLDLDTSKCFMGKKKLKLNTTVYLRHLCRILQ